MRLVRTILAFAIAVSLALLPAGASAHRVMGMADGSASAMQMDSSQTDSSEEMSSADTSMDDCCPDDMKGPVGHAVADKCNMGFCCAGGVTALDDVRAVMFVLHPTTATRLAIPADQVVSFESDGPPFRPPRV